MGYEEVLKDIKEADLKSVYLLYGQEMYLKDVILRKIKEKYIDASFETLNYTYIDGKNTSDNDIINACETLPFMSEKKLVVVEDSSLFKGNNKEESSQKEDKLSEYVSRISSMTCLVFVIKEDKIDNRKKIIKNIKKAGRIVELEKLKNDALEKWALRKFKEHKKTISKNELSYFLMSTSYLDRNTDKTLYDLENEINKIVNYVEDKGEITREDIDFTKPKSLENDIFKLVDYISQKNTSLGLELFNEMILSGEAPQLIMHMIVRQVRLLLFSKLLKEKGYDMKTIGQKINVYHNFIVQKLINQGLKFTEDDLIEGLKKCENADKDMKKGKIEPKLAMEVLIVELSS